MSQIIIHKTIIHKTIIHKTIIHKTIEMPEAHLVYILPMGIFDNLVKTYYGVN